MPTVIFQLQNSITFEAYLFKSRNLIKNLRIGIVEDEAIIAQNLYELLCELDYEVAEPAGDYEEGIKLLKNNSLDLIILDIQLGIGPDGIALGKLINENYRIPFIYLTANADRETVQAAKSTVPAAYLIKPFTKNDLYAAIEIASFKSDSRSSLKPESTFVYLKDGNTLKKVSTDEILFVESEHVYIKIYTMERSYLHRCSLQQFMVELNNPDFIQTHRSYLVNMQHVKEISPNQLKVEQYSIPVSRSFKQTVNDYFSKRN